MNRFVQSLQKKQNRHFIHSDCLCQHRQRTDALEAIGRKLERLSVIRVLPLFYWSCFNDRRFSLRKSFCAAPSSQYGICVRSSVGSRLSS